MYRTRFIEVQDKLSRSHREAILSSVVQETQTMRPQSQGKTSPAPQGVTSSGRQYSLKRDLELLAWVTDRTPSFCHFGFLLGRPSPLKVAI